MSFIPQITCRHCGKKFSAIHNRCPHCGTRRVKQSTRTPSTTTSVRPGTSANARAASNTKYQFIFGCVLIVAVIAAVIVLICASLRKPKEPEIPTPPPTEQVVQTPAPTPTPTPTPEPTPSITSITITFLGSEIPGKEFTQPMGTTIQLGAITYPVEVEAKVQWRSSNEEICTVDQDGLVTPVAPGKASVIAQCGGVAYEVAVIVR